MTRFAVRRSSPTFCRWRKLACNSLSPQTITTSPRRRSRLLRTIIAAPLESRHPIATPSSANCSLSVPNVLWLRPAPNKPQKACSRWGSGPASAAEVRGASSDQDGGLLGAPGRLFHPLLAPVVQNEFHRRRQAFEAFLAGF